MKTLIIDTSHEISYVILAENKEIIFFKKFKNKNLSKELFPSIDQILKETNTDISDLKYIAASIGPGSFTGLRVGAAICKTICFAKKIPLISYVSLQAYIPQVLGKFASIFDAKSEGIYSIEGEIISNETIHSNPKLLSIEEAKKLFDNIPTIVSPDHEVLKEKFKDYKNKISEISFDPIKIITLTEALYQKKKFTDFQTFKLLYLRGPNHIE